MCKGGEWKKWGYTWQVNNCPREETGERWVYDKNAVCERCYDEKEFPGLEVKDHYKWMVWGFCVSPKKISCDHECAKAAKKECPGKPWYSSISDSSSAGIQIDLISILILVEQ